MKSIKIFADGSSLGNPGPGGYAAILKYNDSEKIVSGGEPNTTNNRMELKAVIEAIKVLKEPCTIEIISDSQYVIKGINEWLEGWIIKSFKNVKNDDLWKEYIKVSDIHEIKGTWVKGHAGHIENEQCDKIAKAEAELFKGK